MKQYNSILIVKLSSIGDVLMSIPVCHALRTTYPEARIGWIVEDKAVSVIEEYKDIDVLYVFEKRKIEQWASKLRYDKIIAYIRDFSRKVRKDGWEISLDLQSLPRSSMLPYFAGVPVRVANAAGKWHKVLNTIIIDKSGFKQPAHAIEWYMYFVKSIGLIPQVYTPKFFFPFSQKKNQEADVLMAPLRKKYKKLIGVSCFSQWGTKNWSIDSYKALFTLLSQHDDIGVVLFGTAHEYEVLTSCAEVSEHIHVIAGVLDLSGFASACTYLDAYISGDTGPMHIVAAVGVPQIALFGPTEPRKTGPFSSKSRVVTKDVMCRPCFKKVCPLHGTEHRQCMAHSPEEIATLLRSLL